MERILVAPVAEMDSETLMKHFENRHTDDVKAPFKREPDQPARRLQEPDIWRTYHQAMHRLYPSAYDHTHRDTVRGS